LDNDVCTSERCEIATGTCVIEADAACCVDVTECDDQDTCTEDRCDLNRCVSTQIEGCGTPWGGETPDDGVTLEGGCSVSGAPTAIFPTFLLFLTLLLGVRRP
ncbi:MAG: hypothetical protein JRH20_07955, partial [Deltaproteobacteria bacterium]|nr:hypothetical protein [Deltaproteobacteria bacterium]